jgi:hypothetical protein
MRRNRLVSEIAPGELATVIVQGYRIDALNVSNCGYLVTGDFLGELERRREIHLCLAPQRSAIADAAGQPHRDRLQHGRHQRLTLERQLRGREADVVADGRLRLAGNKPAAAWSPHSLPVAGAQSKHS